MSCSAFFAKLREFYNEVTYQSGAYSAVHKADFVGRPPIILGGNTATGGECFKCYSHSSYFAEIPDKYLINSQGQYIDNAGRVVTEKNSVVNDEYTEYKKIWGNTNQTNLSAPVLVKPTDANKEFKYSEKPY